MKRCRALPGVVGMVVLQGCPPAADGDVFVGLRDPDVTITDEGSGPRNAAPLEPLRVGTWAESTAGAHRVFEPQA
jgi:hypothetical protein